jgi:hypothetical protein
MTDNKPLVIGLCVAALLLLAVVAWKTLMPRQSPASGSEPLVPGAANYRAPAPR